VIYLLDTNTCIRYLNGKNPAVQQKMLTIQPSDMVLCSVVKAELYAGGFGSKNPVKTLAERDLFMNVFASLPFDDAAARIYGQERARLQNLGQMIGPNDLLIASIALAHNLTGDTTLPSLAGYRH
jgi:tRNA(fMet)-specific endonuclease VapC